ncbi:MAG: hypothetical protein P1P77_07945 [Spirochaetaceae bacterium]|nr:hypothetical protein [Spirochaetaceae bacterium]
MMMISKRRVLFYALIVCFIVAALGWYGYQLFLSTGPSGDERRLAAEEILFASIVAVLIITLLTIILLRGAASLDKRLNRLIEQGRNSEILPERDFASMGALGGKLTDLFDLLGQSNHQKTQKISAMQALVVFLVRNQDEAVAICDSAGILRYTSDAFLEKHRLSKVEVLDAPLSEAIPGIPVDQISSQLNRSRDPLEGKISDSPYVCYPFTDRDDELTYLVFFFGVKASHFEKSHHTKEPEAPRRRRTSILTGLDRWITGRGLRERRGRR